MSKPKPKSVRPISADGRVLKKGDTVHVLHTHNAGKTWAIRRFKIHKTNRMGTVILDPMNGTSPLNLWTYCCAPSRQVGDHRIYFDRKEAAKERDRRNADAAA